MGLKPRQKRKPTALILRTSKPDRSSRNGFIWPVSGPVECPDWNPEPVCGNGLHGALWGEGNGALFDWEPSAVWQVVEVAEDDIVDLTGKVKFPRGTVVYSGDRETATRMIQEARPGAVVIGGTVTAGCEGTAIAGDYGTSTSLHRGTAIAGDYGTSTSGNYGTSTSGDYGTSTSLHRGTAIAGNGGTAIAGNYGTSTAGNGGTATAGNYGTSTAGYGGEIRIRWHDGSRNRLAVGYVGEGGIEPNVAYRVENGKLVKS